LEKIRKCRQNKAVETSLLRADRGETAVELNINQKKWGGFAFSSLSKPQSPTGCPLACLKHLPDNQI
jgi:hypothetical protein